VRAAAFIVPVAIFVVSILPGTAVGLHGNVVPPATPIGAVSCQPPAPAPPSPTPESTEPPIGAGPTPTAVPDPEAIVDPLLDPMAAAAAANLQACWNAGDWDVVAGIVTPRFLETALGITAPDAAGRAAALAALDLGPLRIETIGPVGIWTDGRGAVDVFYRRGRGQPLQAVAARWFLLAKRGVVRFDEETPLLPPPMGDRVTIGFAIADDVQPLQWDSLDGGRVARSPVIALHGANRGLTAHTFLLQNTSGETIGLLTLPAWTQGDLVLLDLPAGAYALRDPAVAGSSRELAVGNGPFAKMACEHGQEMALDDGPLLG
jgi:hypothetical protein